MAMLSLSRSEAIRLGTWTCLSCSSPSTSSQRLIANLSRPLICRSHQRQHSSSKPSSPPKTTARAIDTPSKASAQEPSHSAKATPEKRTNTRLSRRKTKDITTLALRKAKDDALLTIPSVPSTQHLHPQDIHVASFFSIHRPISVTASVPPPSSSSAFSSLFARTAYVTHEPSQVVYTISSAVDSLESSAASPAQQFQQLSSEDSDAQSTVSQNEFYGEDPIEVTRFDPSQPEVIHLNIQELVKNFRPFAPPPPPVAMDTTEEHTSRQNSRQVVEQKSFSAVLTIVEKTHSDGRKTYETRTSSIREDPLPVGEDEKAVSATEHTPLVRQPFLNHMRARQRRWEEFRHEKARGGAIWRLISVRRQRKLRMKKHKYKKLMQRTRNIRRKLEKK